MSIKFNEETKIFSIDTAKSTYQMQVDKYGFLLHLYYGERVEGEMDYLLTYSDRGFSGNPYDVDNDRTYSMDALPQEYPTLGNGDFRNAALVVENEDGSVSCDLRYDGHKIKKGKYTLPGLPAVFANDEGETLEIVLSDRISGVEVTLLYGVIAQTDIITRAVRVKNTRQTQITIKKAMTACLDFLYGDFDAISFYGRHAMERNVQRKEIAHGCFSIGSKRGTSSHQYNPGVILADRKTTENSGNCYGLLYMFSGDFSAQIEKDQYNQTRALIGMQDDYFSYTLSKDEELYLPETIMSFSSNGLAELSKHYHKCIREHVCRGKYAHQTRPVLVNSWEAAYFDFTGDTIVDLAKEAKKVGIDMVVMDDGWFGKRDDDNSGLGDWVTNEAKLGCTLGELIHRINAEGVKFGIWVEPEMVSEDSDLYRAHPDWAITIPGRKPVRGRNQLVLDFSREEVRNHVYHQICAVLDQGNIEYVKWDMNRSLTDLYSTTTSTGKFMYQYVLGVYDFLEKITQKYPDILFEGCSGGGGRFDAGMMYYTPQIWCSDNTDAVNRLKIQYGSSFFYPTSVVGSHVSAVPNHQTGRSVALDTRSTVAMSGTFGYELDLGKLSEEEKLEVKEQIVKYKEYADLIANGDYYRLSDPFCDDYTAWLFVSEDCKRVLFNMVTTDAEGNGLARCVRFAGLDRKTVYKDKETGKCYSGAMLMAAGLPVVVTSGEYQSRQIELTAI